MTTNRSALKPNGGTRQWRRLRQPFEHHLATIGPLPCRRCGAPITATDRWHLGHPDDNPRALGGDDRDLAPECAACSTAAGARLAHHLARTKRDTDGLTPSRDW